ncbi:MAG: fibrobacter succinogenes major paralogous domain-containing protein [Paludibacter sp.]|nr:fibrobacter succinogenes major paralogous domain-containing protein [Paludibacter sp.]
MKIFGTLLIALFLSCNFAVAQDTLYVYRSGLVVNKLVVAGIDSVTFYKNYNIPAPETVTDQDGNLYHTVKIGTQTWMTENLKVSKYRNGELIGSTGSVYTDLTYATFPKYQWAYNGVETNVPVYGRLYTWHVVVDSRNIAPEGWHVASDAEWAVMQNYLIANGYNYDKTKIDNKIAKSLCTTTLWDISSITGAPSCNQSQNNSSGFSMVPGGYRGVDGYYYLLGGGNDIWTSTENSTTLACARGCGANYPNLGANNLNKNYGFSVRCIKNELTIPVLSTAVPASITDISATCGGTITSDGYSAVTARGICWSTKPNPTIADNKTSIGTGIGTFSGSITGLMADSTYYVRAYATNSVGTAYGDPVSFKTLHVPVPTVTDADGNIYHMITIGNQTWMLENLKSSKYNDGTAIPKVTENAAWANLTTPGYCWYNNDSIANKNVYGALYNWYAVKSGKLAPAGWHVASDAEWTQLTTTLGGEVEAGAKMKEGGLSHWCNPNQGATNGSGFTGLPGGLRSYSDGTFRKVGNNGYFWTTTQSDSLRGWDRELFYNQVNCFRYNFDSKHYGFSVRCVKDSVATVATVITNAVNTISDTTALSGGNVLNDGGAAITARGVCWSTSEHPTTANSKTIDGEGKGAFTSSMTGLKADSTYYVRAYATNSVGTSYGNQVSFKTAHLPAPTVTDADGNIYHTVTIGTQTWMVENLKTTKLNDGTAIPRVNEKASWGNLTTPGYCWYNNDSIANKNTYGAIYNWYSVNTGKLAPAGWHVPTDVEWTTLTDYLGLDVAGGKLKETGTLHWASPNTGATNETGFTAVPGGYRGNNDGTFDVLGTGCFWWTSTPQTDIYSFFRSVGYSSAGIGRSGSQRVNGLSVRCIKD